MSNQNPQYFPKFRFQDGEKWLFNPVLKKRYKNLPEERVRLAFVEKLLANGWNRNRIGFEAPVSLSQSENPLRADLVLYDKRMKPYALVECKSDGVPLNVKTAEQIARYNSSIAAEYLCITNGPGEFWFELSDGKSIQTDAPNQTVEDKPSHTPSYWIERGFIAEKTEPAQADQITRVLNLFWNRSDKPARYLDFKPPVIPFPIDHYYQILGPDKDLKVAASILANGASHSYLTAICNQNGTNRGVLTLQFDGLLSGEPDSVKLYTEDGLKSIQPTILFPSGTDLLHESDINNLESSLLGAFREEFLG